MNAPFAAGTVQGSSWIARWLVVLLSIHLLLRHRTDCMMASTTYIALLRGINVGAATRISMADLRALCEELGWEDVRTYIQSGNIVFRSSSARKVLETELEKAMPRKFGVSPAVIIRGARDWKDIAGQNPFAREARKAPKFVMLALSKKRPVSSVLETLRSKADSELVERVGDAVWIYFSKGSGRSRLTPAVLDRAAGSPVTTRNLNTVLKLADMVSE